MNDRIAELAKQAKLLTDNGGPRYINEEQDIVEFTNLLIAESIEVMKQHDFHGEWLGEKIKEHFNIPFESKYE
jgi:hypothetical protein